MHQTMLVDDEVLCTVKQCTFVCFDAVCTEIAVLRKTFTQALYYLNCISSINIRHGLHTCTCTCTFTLVYPVVSQLLVSAASFYEATLADILQVRHWYPESHIQSSCSLQIARLMQLEYSMLQRSTDLLHD